MSVSEFSEVSKHMLIIGFAFSLSMHFVGITSNESGPGKSSKFSNFVRLVGSLTTSAAIMLPCYVVVLIISILIRVQCGQVMVVSSIVACISGAFWVMSGVSNLSVLNAGVTANEDTRLVFGFDGIAAVMALSYAILTFSF